MKEAKASKAERLKAAKAERDSAYMALYFKDDGAEKAWRKACRKVREIEAGEDAGK